MKITFLVILISAIISGAVWAAQPSPELKSAAKEVITSYEALEKVNELQRAWNQRWTKRRLTPDEDKQADREKNELLQVGDKIDAAQLNATERFKTLVKQSNISFPEGITILDAARMCVAGNMPISVDSESSSRERRGLASLSAEVVRRGTDPTRGVAQAGRYVLYTVYVKATLDGPSRGSSRVDLTSHGSDNLAAAITGNNTISFESGESSASARLTISAKPKQRVEIQGRYSDLDRSTSESTSFYAE